MQQQIIGFRFYFTVMKKTFAAAAAASSADDSGGDIKLWTNFLLVLLLRAEKIGENASFNFTAAL
jgi:hypothetical protein